MIRPTLPCPQRVPKPDRPGRIQALKLDSNVRSEFATRLQAFPAQGTSNAQLMRAAVVVAIAHTGHGASLDGLPDHECWQTTAALLLTRRARSLRRHSGQWALPGGRIDVGETPEQAALRELHEEIGLVLNTDSILGRLDDIVTRSGFAMTPIVVWAGSARELVPNPEEVASVHRIPVTEFLRDDAPMLSASDESEHPELRMPVGTSWIAAPTAAVLYQFREVCLLGRHTRVGHFEQPRFTWR